MNMVHTSTEQIATLPLVDGAGQPQTSNALGLLLSLQHADSFFPSGAMAFSWGLESLMRDGHVRDASTLAEFIEAQLLHRWQSFDQGIVSAAWQAASTHREYPQHSAQPGSDSQQAMLQQLIALDEWVDAMTLVPTLREGSRRLGLTLLTVHAKLGTPGARSLQNYIADSKGSTPHLAVVQGYLWQQLGMSEAESRAVSAHTVCVSATSAAVRLGLIGHLDAQRILMRLQAPIAETLRRPVPDVWSLSNNLLATDIAGLRHGLHDARMFAN